MNKSCTSPCTKFGGRNLYCNPAAVVVTVLDTLHGRSSDAYGTGGDTASLM